MAMVAVEEDVNVNQRNVKLLNVKYLDAEDEAVVKYLLFIN